MSIEEGEALFSVGTSFSTRLLEFLAMGLFAILSLLAFFSSALYVSITFALLSIAFLVIYFRMARFDFYEDRMKIQRRKKVLGETRYSDVKEIFVTKGTRSTPPRISLELKNSEKKLGWVGKPMNKDLDVDLLTWLRAKIGEK